MPQRNTIKDYAPHAYYHVFARGVNKQKIFIDNADYNYFVSLFERYLTKTQKMSSAGVAYPNYNQDIKLGAFCLMANHLHLLIYQSEDREALKKFMSSLLTSYSKYFNKKYKRAGSLFESRYKAKLIDDDSYLSHISRYIHMNPRRWGGYRYSSLQYMFREHVPEWLHDDIAIQEFKSKKSYYEFLRGYQKNKDELDEIKHQLADA